ncbi:MAG: type II toxin-antitoxin system RelE/ParE family toxin [Terriglobales bacterium]
MKVRWTGRALAHMREIREYIAADSPAAAERMISALFEAAARLHRFPESGRLAGEWNGRPYREIVEPPYRILHEIQDDTVYILAVIHGRRDVAQLIANWKEHR